MGAGRDYVPGMTQFLLDVCELRRPIGKASVARLSNDEVCELSEELTVRAMNERDRFRSGELRQRLDLVNREGERRKLFTWR